MEEGMKIKRPYERQNCKASTSREDVETFASTSEIKKIF
jgi:hypothetical protein